MCTTDMNGFNKGKKLSLSISKDKFLTCMLFKTNNEKKRCIKYLELKGIAYHTILVNYIGLNDEGKLEYTKVKNLYILDKRLRNILYKYLSALEEGIRAFISNRLSNNIERIKKMSMPIYNAILSGNDLSKELENLDFNKLLNLSKRLSSSEKRMLYGNTKHLKENLDAVRRLRNTVSHHRILFVYEGYLECYINDKELAPSLLNNVKNLLQMLNPFYKDFFIKAINNSSFDDDKKFRESLPDTAKLSI